jgi:hypothetical protein
MNFGVDKIRLQICLNSVKTMFMRRKKSATSSLIQYPKVICQKWYQNPQHKKHKDVKAIQLLDREEVQELSILDSNNNHQDK